MEQLKKKTLKMICAFHGRQINNANKRNKSCRNKGRSYKMRKNHNEVFSVTKRTISKEIIERHGCEKKTNTLKRIKK